MRRRRAAAAAGDDLDGPPRRGAGGGASPNAMSPEDVLPRTWARTSTPRTRCSRRCGSATRSPRSGRTRRTLMSPGSYALRSASRGAVAVDYSNASSLALLDPRTRDVVARGPRTVDGHRPRRCSPSSSARPSRSATITAAFAEATGLWTRRRSRRGRVRRRDGGDARRRRVRAGRGVRRRRDGRAGVRRVGRAARGPDDARRVPPARRPGRVAAREPRVRLRRQPPVVARPVRADRAGGRGRGARRRLRPALARRPNASRRAPRGSCSCRACRARWRPSGTAPRAACSTGSRSRTRGRT